MTEIHERELAADRGSVEAEVARSTASGTFQVTLGWTVALSGRLFWRLARLRTAATLSFIELCLQSQFWGPLPGLLPRTK